MKKTNILAAITLSAILLTSCTAGNGAGSTSSIAETSAVAVQTGTVIDKLDEPAVETTAATTPPEVAVQTETPQTTTTATTPAPETTPPPQTTTTTAAETKKPDPEWTESKASGTMYVNTSCYSRKKAVLGAETVALYDVNDKVTVTAKTNTGYYKLDNGSFIHGDYLSENKLVVTTTVETTAKKPETTPKPVDTEKPEETTWKFTKADCEYIINECYKWADKNGYKYKRVSEVPNYDKTYEVNPDGPYYDENDNWIGLNCQYGEVYKNSSWNSSYETIGHPYSWGTGRVDNKNEEIKDTITDMCRDIEYYNEEGYTPVLDFTPYSEFVSYAKGRPGWTGCSDLVDDGTIDFIIFVIYAA